MPAEETGCPAGTEVLASEVSGPEREYLGVGLGTTPPAVSQIRTGQSEARGPGGAEHREQRFSPRLRQVEGTGGRK